MPQVFARDLGHTRFTTRPGHPDQDGTDQPLPCLGKRLWARYLMPSAMAGGSSLARTLADEFIADRCDIAVGGTSDNLEPSNKPRTW